MGQRSIRFAGVVAVAFVGSMMITGSASAGNELVADRSFERPTVPDGAFDRSFAPGQHIGPWTVSQSDVFLATGPPEFMTPPDGSQALVLRPPSTIGDGRVCQTLSGFVSGAVYRLKLSVTAIGSAGMTVTLGDAVLEDLAIHGAEPANFIEISRKFTATEASAALCVEGRPSVQESYSIVDNVRIKPFAG
jgi:hypothetical protein